MADPNAVVRDRIESDASKWAALNARGQPPPKSSRFRIGFVADQDSDSFVERDGEKVWLSYLRWASLVYDGSTYSIDLGYEHQLDMLTGADQSNRGAEFSALELYNGKLLTMDDRTGSVLEICKAASGASGNVLQVQPLLDGAGSPVMAKAGGQESPSGREKASMKMEWSTTKGDALIIGSTGAPKFGRDGEIENEDCLWAKSIDANAGFKVSNLDWRQNFNTLRTACGCADGAAGGYVTHESGRWSSEHNAWFFFPRKVSREKFDPELDVARCGNLMLSVPANGDGEAPWDVADVLVNEMVTHVDVRGCSDFIFVPNTSDTHVLVLRTEELSTGTRTFASVVDLTGKQLMADGEIVVSSNRKYEGCELILESEGWEAYDELNAYENAKREQESGKPTDSHEGCSCVLQ